jgi:hypothetical protein
MSSWATLLAATGFKPDFPRNHLTLTPSAPGDFHAPWVTANGYGRISRKKNQLTLECLSGQLTFKTLKVNVPSENPRVRITGTTANSRISRADGTTTIEFTNVITLNHTQTCTVE